MRSPSHGEVLRFKRDLLGVSARDFDGRVTKVAGKNGVGGIENPHFLHGLELEKERARLLSVIKSDGWVSHGGKVGYVEQNLKRFDIVEQNLQVWGDFELGRYYNSKTGCYETKLPSPFWEALTFWGFSPGDKPIHNEGLPIDIERLSYESMAIYLGELIPEDGSFEKKGKFSWTRTIVLDSGIKEEKYGFESLISSDIVDFIKNRGDDENHPRGEPRKFIYVTELQEIAKAQDSEKSERILAEELHSIVYANPSKLIEDEARMAERLGIEVSVNPRKIRYSPRTGRVSVYYECQTSGVEAAEKFAIICPPNDVRKRTQVKNWIRQRNLDSTIKEIEKQGIPYNKWWL